MKISTDELRELIKEASQCYYEIGEIILPDPLFDTLVEELKRRCPDDELLNKVGFGHSPSKPVLHIVRVESLPKKKVWWDVEKWRGKLITPKFDGAGIVVYYRKGRLDKALTRGDGRSGKDVTDKAVAFVPDFIDSWEEIDLVAVRGEVVVPLQYSKDNNRNQASGILNRNDTKGVEKLLFVPYHIVYSTTPLGTDRLEVLTDLQQKFGVLYPIKKLNVTTEEEARALEEEMSWVTTVAEEKFTVPIDGVVMDLWPHYTTEPLEERVGYIYKIEQLALKFPDERKTTRVLRVVWNVSKHGKLTPVAEIEPVTFDGAQVRNISLHSAELVETLGVDSGAVVSVVRANKIIPQIADVHTAVDPNIPEHCPLCGHPLFREGAHLFCKNEKCESRIGRCETFLKHLLDLAVGRVGVGPAAIRSFLEWLKVKNLDDLLDNLAQIEKVLEEYNARTVAERRLKEALGKIFSRKYTLSELAVALSLPNLGEAFWKEVESYGVDRFISDLESGETPKLRITAPQAKSVAIFADTLLKFLNVFGKVLSR